MNDITVALYSDGACGTTPIMPFLGARFDGAEFAKLCKTYLAAALLRCGFDVYDANPDGGAIDNVDLVMRINRRNADAAISVTAAGFGSRKSFNDASGATVRFPGGRFTARSRIFAEDICAKLPDCKVAPDTEFGMLNCKAAMVCAGYLTNFDEAKRLCDPDFAVMIAESAALGACEHFDMPYIRRDDVSSYPLLCSSRRGKKVKMLQALLNAYGAKLPVDGAYGGETDAAVRAFVSDNGKRRDGGVTADVWRDLLLTDLPELAYGSANNAARYIQRKLRSKLYPVEQTGVFDEKTLVALNEFLAETVGGGFALDKTSKIDADIYKLLAPIGGGRPRLF